MSKLIIQTDALEPILKQQRAAFTAGRFSHAKSILKRGKISFAHMLFPPHGKAIHKFVYKFFIR
jgi:hypothetical protein